MLSHDVTTNPSSEMVLKRLWCPRRPILNAWNVSSKISCHNPHTLARTFPPPPNFRELLTLAWEYHYDNHACHTYIFPPRWPTLQQNIKVNRGENCVGDTCGTWHQRSFTTVHVVCMYNQPFSIFLWWWSHMERHYGGLPAEATERHLQGDREDVLEMSAARHQK